MDQDPHLPRYIYHLWRGRTSEEKPQPLRQLWRTYSTPAHAKHDALCWLIQRQNTAGASIQSYYSD